MPTSSATDSAAATAASAESAAWASLAERWHPDRNREIWNDLAPFEALVIPETDPSSDLEKRARRWSYPLSRSDLSDLALFAAALARMEGEAWLGGDGVVATQAFEERRFLAADRVLPWAIPWLRAVARCFPDSRESADQASAALLEIGDRHRPAPFLTGSEGLFPPGHDSYGPVDLPAATTDRIVSLWGGLVVFRRSLESITGVALSVRLVSEDWLNDADIVATIATWYEVTAMRWRRLADRHPGTARLWQELANRAQETAESAK
jgi:hypothetical protein